MQTTTERTTTQTFNEWYNGLPSNKQGEYRSLIMEQLAIGTAMFYHLKNGLRKISPAERSALNTIAGMELMFPGDEDLTSSLNLTK